MMYVTQPRDQAGATLRLKESSALPIGAPIGAPVEADIICPDRFVGRSQAELATLPVFYGRRKLALGELFEVKVEDENSDTITVIGDLSHVKRIGHA